MERDNRLALLLSCLETEMKSIRERYLRDSFESNYDHQQQPSQHFPIPQNQMQTPQHQQQQFMMPPAHQGPLQQSVSMDMYNNTSGRPNANTTNTTSSNSKKSKSKKNSGGETYSFSDL